MAILVGAGAREAASEIIEVASRLGAGVAKALLGKDVLPDDLPFVTGAIGLLGTKPSYDLMMKCDTLLMIGTGFPWSEFLPRDGQARAVQIDIDASMLGLRYPVDVNLHGDAAETLRALLPLLNRERRSRLATNDDSGGPGMVADRRGARHDAGRPGQPAAGSRGKCLPHCPPMPS